MKIILIVYSKKSGAELARQVFETSAKAAVEWMLYISRGFKAALITEE